MAVGVKVVTRPGSLSQQLYLPAIAEGMGVTFKHFVKNFFGNLVGMRKKTDIQTIEYPEEKKAYPARHRGLHRLMLREDGLAFDDGTKRDLQGLYTISQDTLRSLPDDAVLNLFRRGYLHLIYMMIASLQQISVLAQKKNRRLPESAK